MRFSRPPGARRPRAPRKATAPRHANATRCEPLENRLLFVAGELDFTFSGDGKQSTDFGSNDGAVAVTVDPFGRIIAAGFADGGSSNFAVARYLPNGVLDPSFNNLPTPTISNGDGKLSFTFGGVERATSVAVQADGKIVVAGYTNVGTAGGLDTNNFAVARINANGTLDNTFSTDGRQTVDFGADDRANAVVIQPDGKIIVVGQFDGGSSNFAIARLNVNGTLDATFSTDGKQNVTFGGVERATSVALTGTDILVAGMTSAGATGANTNNFAVARLNTDGTLDLAFHADGKQTVDFGGNDQATSVSVDNVGRVILGGFGAASNNFALARLSSAGALDPSFNNLTTPVIANGDGKLSFTLGGIDRPRGVDLELHGADQEIYIAGFTSVGGTTPDNFAIARVRANGTIDTGFGGGDGIQITELGADDEGNAIALQTDGKAVVAGSSAGNFALVRYLGELDPAFGFDGRQTVDFGNTDTARAVAVQTDGRIVVAGDWDGGAADFAVARFLPNGALDATFSTDGRANFTFGAGAFGGVERATAVALQPDRKILVAGYTDAGALAGNPFNFAVLRLLPDGTLDTTFGGGDGKATIDFGANDRANAMLIQPDGKIVLVGQFDGGSSNFAAARLNPNGSLDATFDIDGRANYTFGGIDRANAVARAANGDIYLVGVTNTGTTGNDFGVIRINPNGAPDTTFSTDGRLTIDFNNDDHATGVAIRPDGRVVIGGYSDDGESDFAVAQLTGSALDSTFGGGDGKLELFNADADDFANGLALLENGKIVMVGYTNSATSTPSNFAVARVLANGSGPDPSFNADGEQHLDFGADDKAYAVAVQPDGKVVVAGSSAGNFAVARYDSAPTVTRVYVSSSAWSDGFLGWLRDNALGSFTYGFPIPAGRAQLTTVPWININEISVTFSEAVEVAADDMRILGVNTPSVPLDAAAFSYDPATRTATWRLPAGQFLRNDRFTFELDADAAGVKTSLGAALDGDWNTASFETFPSGDGAAGGDFRFAVNVLPGDADRNLNRVNAADQGYVKARLNRSVTSPTSPGQPSYNIFADVTGDGRINAADQGAVKARLNNALPPAPLAAGAGFSEERIADAVLA